VNFVSPSRTIKKAIANTISFLFEIDLEFSQIPIEIGYPKYDAHYTSTIALMIANRINLNPLQIAEAIAQNLITDAQWQIQALGKGWINIKLSDQYIAKSLLDLAQWQIEGLENHDGFWQRQAISMVSVNHSPEPILQYAYARCCALIRLANQENKNVAIHELPLHSCFSDCLEPAETGLLMQNLAIAAYLESLQGLDSEDVLDSDQSRTKLSRSLAESFLDFYTHCRIFGVSRKIAIRRILLIKITQKLLLAIAPSPINYAMYL